jgi:hypothetical protein
MYEHGFIQIEGEDVEMSVDNNIQQETNLVKN